MAIRDRNKNEYFRNHKRMVFGQLEVEINTEKEFEELTMMYVQQERTELNK